MIKNHIKRFNKKFNLLKFVSRITLQSEGQICIVIPQKKIKTFYGHKIPSITIQLWQFKTEWDISILNYNQEIAQIYQFLVKR